MRWTRTPNSGLSIQHSVHSAQCSLLRSPRSNNSYACCFVASELGTQYSVSNIQYSALIVQKPEPFIRMSFRCLLLVASRRMSKSMSHSPHSAHSSHSHPHPRPHSNAIETLMKPEISWDAVRTPSGRGHIARRAWASRFSCLSNPLIRSF